MKKTIQKLFLFCLLILTGSQLKAQAPIQEGGSDYNGDLWHIRNIGVGSDVAPEARVHIFSGLALMPNGEPTYSLFAQRPFLITGKVDPNLPPPQRGRLRSFVVTVDKFGQFGVDVLNPLTKMHLHNGIFTISAGNINEPTRWEIHGTNNTFAIKDFNANRYRLWIARESGNVGIGENDPDEKLHVGGNVIVDGNQTINGFLMIKGTSNATSDGENEILLGDDGFIRAREIKVDIDDIPTPDYVFKADYKLMSLKDLKTFVEKNNHLPNVKSEAEFKKEGTYSLGEMNMKLLEKVEELTLYVLDLQAQIDELKNR